MEKFSIQKCVIDSLRDLGYRIIIVRPEGIFFYFNIHTDVLSLPEPNENGFYHLDFDNHYKI